MTDEAHLVGCRTHLLKRTMCLACPTVLESGELVQWIYVEQDGKVFPGTSMFACLSHESEELKFFALAEVKRRADAARRANVVSVVIVRQEDEKERWWVVTGVGVTDNPHARTLVAEATKGKRYAVEPLPADAPHPSVRSVAKSE